MVYGKWCMVNGGCIQNKNRHMKPINNTPLTIYHIPYTVNLSELKQMALSLNGMAKTADHAKRKYPGRDREYLSYY